MTQESVGQVGWPGCYAELIFPIVFEGEAWYLPASKLNTHARQPDPQAHGSVWGGGEGGGAAEGILGRGGMGRNPKQCAADDLWPCDTRPESWPQARPLAISNPLAAHSLSASTCRRRAAMRHGCAPTSRGSSCCWLVFGFADVIGFSEPE